MTRIAGLNRFFLFSQSEYDYLMSCETNVGKGYCKAILDTDWTTGRFRKRSFGYSDVCHKRTWQMLKEHGLAYHTGRYWKLEERSKSMRWVRIDIDIVERIVLGLMTLKQYHRNRNCKGKSAAQIAVRKQIGRKGGVHSRGTARNGKVRSSDSPEGSNASLQIWKRFNMSSSTWYRLPKETRKSLLDNNS